MPTNNRKRESCTSTINHRGTDYAINGGKTRGVYLPIVHKAIAQLDICIERWGRVFTLRFDLHQKVKGDDSYMLTKFRKNLSERIQRKYGISEIGYQWVREQEIAKQQHYHFALFMDGDKIRHPSALNKIITQTWERLNEGNFVFFPRNCFLMVSNEQTKARAVYRVSYFAKVRGKGYRPNQCKDYSTSRLKSKNQS